MTARLGTLEIAHVLISFQNMYFDYQIAEPSLALARFADIEERWALLRMAQRTTEGLSRRSISNIELLHDKTGAPLASCSKLLGKRFQLLAAVQPQCHEVESFEHFLLECPVFARSRLKHFGSHTLTGVFI